MVSGTIIVSTTFRMFLGINNIASIVVGILLALQITHWRTVVAAFVIMLLLDAIIIVSSLISIATV